MALGEDEAFHEWSARGAGVHPAVQRVVRDWIEAAAGAPWKAPSTPIPELSDQPIHEIREVEVPDSGGIHVFYKHHYATGIVDLIWVGELPSP